MFGEVIIKTQSLKKGNEINSSMQSGEFVIGDTITPFVLQKTAYGKISEIHTSKPFPVSLICCEKIHSTPFTKKNYMSILISTKPVQARVYIKKDHLKDFFAAFCMAAI